MNIRLNLRPNLELYTKTKEKELLPDEPNAEGQPSAVIIPEDKPVTASAEDIIEQNMRRTLFFESQQPVSPGVYEVLEGRVVVNPQNDGTIGVEVIGAPINDISKILRRITNVTPTETLTSNPSGVNGEIDEPVSQGGTGDCWIITAILALNSTEEGKAAIKAALDIQDNGDVIVTFSGLGVSIRVSAAEIAKYDTDNNKRDAFSNGDNDMLVFELATEKLFEQYPELREGYGLEDKRFSDADGYIDQGGFATDLLNWLTGQQPVEKFAIDGLSGPFDIAEVEEWVTVPDTVEGYAGQTFPRPSSMTFDEMFNSSKTDFSNKYISWYNDTITVYNQTFRDTLVNGMSEEETLEMLSQLYEQQPCAAAFGLYIYAGETVKSAECTDGTTFTFGSSGNGQFGGHAFAIVGMTEDTITFVNPWDSTKEITMTWEEFAKLGIGGIQYCPLEKAEQPEADEPVSDDVDGTDETDGTDDVDNPPSEPVVSYTESELRGKYSFSAEEVETYFIKTSDGSYILNRTAIDSDPDLAGAKTAEELKEKLAAKAAKTPADVDDAGKTGDFKDMAALQTYVHSVEALNFVANALNITFTDETRSEFMNLATEVANKHADDVTIVTKKQILEELTDAYAEKLKNDSYSAIPGGIGTIDDAPIRVFGEISSSEIREFVFSDEFKKIIEYKDGITDWSYGFTYEEIAEAVIKSFAGRDTIRELEVISKFVNEYNNRIKLLKSDEAYDKINKTVSSVSNWLGTQMSDISTTFKGGFTLNSDGNISFTDSNAEKIFNSIIAKLVAELRNDEREGYLEQIGGEAGLRKLVQSAWITTYGNYGASGSKKFNTKDFVNTMMNNLSHILGSLKDNPEYAKYYTEQSYNENYLTYDISNYSTVYCSNYRVFSSDGKYHLDNDESDKIYQEMMDALLEKLYKKYPDIAEDLIGMLFNAAQGEALSDICGAHKDIPSDISISGNSGKARDIAKLVLYHFNRLLTIRCTAGELPDSGKPKETETWTPVSSQTAEQNKNIQSGAEGALKAVSTVSGTIVSTCKGANNGKDTIHTEFGIDQNGNIVFQESSTQAVYDTIYNQIVSTMKNYDSDNLNKLGGEAVLKKLLQAAWIDTYNKYDSSQSNNLARFVNQVINNLEKMFDKLKTNPEYLEVFTQHTSYADSTLTNGLTHYNTNTTYGKDETIIYKGEPTIYTDGTVHISNTTDDNDYQTTMNELLGRLKNKYKSIDPNIITSVFQKAQYQALKAMQSNKADCPYGTGNNHSRVEDSKRNWGGKDSRDGDHFKVHMDELVQMTLYYFDKLLYNELLK